MTISEVRAPLTFGQLSVVLSLAAYQPDGLQTANLINVWPVPEGAGVAQVADAWNRLVEAHESLRTTYDLGSLQQIIHPPSRHALPSVDIDDISAAAAHVEAMSWSVKPIPIDRGVPWRAFVATCDLEPLYLVIIVHHIAADNGAAQILERQFGELVGGSPLAPQPRPQDMARAQRIHARPDALQYWETRWRGFDEADRDRTDHSARRRASVYSRPALLAARATALRTRTSVQSVVLAMGALQLGRVRRRSTLTLGLMAANRFDEEWSGLVSSMNQCVPITVDLAPTQSPDAYVRTVHLASLGAYVNGCFDVEALGSRVGESDPTFFSNHYNYLGEILDDPSSASPLGRGEAVWRSSTQRNGPNCHLAIAVGEGLLIGVGASEAYLPGMAPEHVAHGIRSALEELANESAPYVGSLGFTER